jgi:hypothetical protein
MGARLKVREIASRWRQGDRSWVSWTPLFNMLDGL